jgi:hypothetical protein
MSNFRRSAYKTDGVKNSIPVQRLHGLALERVVEKYGDISPTSSNILRYLHAMHGPRKLDILEALLVYMEEQRDTLSLAIHREIWKLLGAENT